MTIIAPGHHLLIDFWGCRHLDEVTLIDQAMREAASACGATVLEVNLHHFGDGAGITGVALLAESHISIHTWPELGFAALDVFMCGKCDPAEAVPVLERWFQPARREITRVKRG